MKGSVLDLGVLSILLLTLGISILFSYTLYVSFEEKTLQMIQTNEELNKSEYGLVSEVENIDSSMRFNYFLYDKVFLVVFIALTVTMLWLARNINSHPVFFIISVFALMMSVVVAWIVQNIYYYFANASEITSAANEMTAVSTLLGNMPLVVVVLFVLLVIVMYTGKSDEGVSWGLK